LPALPLGTPEGTPAALQSRWKADPLAALAFVRVTICKPGLSNARQETRMIRTKLTHTWLLRTRRSTASG